MLLINYRYGPNPNDVPLADDYWDESLVAAAGFDPDDEEVAVCRLARGWNGHPEGTQVVTGLTVQGHKFTIIA